MGTPASFMDLELYSVSDKFLQKIDNNEALLGSYPVDDDCRIHVCNAYVVLLCCHICGRKFLLDPYLIHLRLGKVVYYVMHLCYIIAYKVLN